jgi:APA family basic amino acid/polyamine antiporter
VLVGVAVIALLSLLNFRGIKESVSFNMGDGPLLLVISGASLAFYALIGFEDSVNVAEETHAAPRAFPGTLFLGLGIAGAVYLLVTVVASMAVPTDALAGSDGPLLEVVQVGHAGRRTPWTGTLLSGALAAVLVVIGDLETLADTTVLLLLFAFLAVHASVLVLRRTPVDHEHFRAWTALPVLGGLCCAALIVQKHVEDTVVFAYAGGLLAFGLVLWLLARGFGGPTEEIDPAKLAD